MVRTGGDGSAVAPRPQGPMLRGANALARVAVPHGLTSRRLRWHVSCVAAGFPAASFYSSQKDG
jgi:hypothetical protein